jgi:hypothetical protein
MQFNLAIEKCDRAIFGYDLPICVVWFARQTDKGKLPVADTTEKLALISDVAASYLRRNSIGLDQIGAVVNSVTQAMQTLSGFWLVAAPLKPRVLLNLRRSQPANRLSRPVAQSNPTTSFAWIAAPR